MAKINYQLHISYDKFTNKPNMISFFKNGNTATDHFYDAINFNIRIDPTPILALNCYSSNDEIEFYEYGINYIIDNKIGKYKNIKIFKHNYIEYFNIFAYFDIIDKELLVQLL